MPPVVSDLPAIQKECQVQGRGGTTLEGDGVQAAALWLMASFSQASLSTCLVNVVASWKMLKVKPTPTDWGSTKGS